MNPTLSPRRRRLRWTWLGLVVAAVAALAWGLLRQSSQRVTRYRPGEESSDITSALSQALPAGAPQPNFVSVAKSAGLGEFQNFAGARTSQMPEDIGPGLAWGDFDGDGDDDLFLVAAGGSMDRPMNELAPSKLYENRGDGTFVPVAGFPELRLHGTGAAWGDYDGDGRLDLVVAGFNQLRLLHNEGEKDFTLDPRLGDRLGFWTGVAWGDYDGDRRLDLYVCGYVDYTAHANDRDTASMQLGAAVPFTLNPSSFTPGRNLLFHQERDGSFREVAEELKVHNPEGRSLGAVWHDFDQDGWLDLYVANDVSDNVFYHNRGNGTFEDLSHPALVADYRSAMGLAVGDFDRDGDDDLHVTHWVAQENALYDNALVQLRGTNGVATMRTNSGPGLRFFDVADQRGLGQIALPFVGWGTEFADLDQDGWLDLLVANGSTLEEEGPYPRHLKPQELFVFWNRRGEYFHDLAALNPALAEKHNSRGLAVADFDNDGDLDFAVADLGEGVRLFRNDLVHGHWLKVRLVSRQAGGSANGFGDGSTATVWLEGVPLRRTVGGVSYLSQGSRTLHWGLGTATRIARLSVRWHAGGTQEFHDLSADTTYELVEGDPTPHRLALHSNPPARPTEDRTANSNPAASASERERQLAFWKVHRAGMDAMKVQGDNLTAIRHFREAIALNPSHEDARYYLGLCLASQGDSAAALKELADLQQLNPQSHRAWQQWGVVRALSAKHDEELRAAEQALERAHALNPEETGALLVLAEVALLRGQTDVARQRLVAATQTNPRAVGGFFLRGYLAWRAGDAAEARQWLEATRRALGPDWQPKGATSEGDVRRKQHVEKTPLTSYWERWDGGMEPAQAYAALGSFLSRTPSSAP